MKYIVKPAQYREGYCNICNQCDQCTTQCSDRCGSYTSCGDKIYYV